jgi:voltage-gated sodium channel
MDWLRKVIQDPRTERFIVALIVINPVTLGLETSHAAMARYGPLLTTIDRVIIAIFVIEISRGSRCRAGRSSATAGTSSA